MTGITSAVILLFLFPAAQARIPATIAMHRTDESTMTETFFAFFVIPFPPLHPGETALHHESSDACLPALLYPVHV